MNDFNEIKTITINNQEIEMPDGAFCERNAQSLLFAGYLMHALGKDGRFDELGLSKDELELINMRLDDVECWLVPALKGMGDAVSSIDPQEIELESMRHVGYLISSLVELLGKVQKVRRRFDEVSSNA